MILNTREIDRNRIIEDVDHPDHPGTLYYALHKTFSTSSMQYETNIIEVTNSSVRYQERPTKVKERSVSWQIEGHYLEEVLASVAYVRHWWNDAPLQPREVLCDCGHIINWDRYAAWQASTDHTLGYNGVEVKDWTPKEAWAFSPQDFMEPLSDNFDYTLNCPLCEEHEKTNIYRVVKEQFTRVIPHRCLLFTCGHYGNWDILKSQTKIWTYESGNCQYAVHPSHVSEITCFHKNHSEKGRKTSIYAYNEDDFQQEAIEHIQWREKHSVKK